MVAPVSTQLTTSSLPQTASLPLQGTGGETSVAPSVQLPTLSAVPDKQVAQGNTGDTVSLSSSALDMSKALNEQADKRAELKKEAVKEQQATETTVARSNRTAGKVYPPFMGNSEALKALKESSPALYREILRMIVPPPLNLSPTELQMLRGVQDSGDTSSTLSTTA